MIKHVTSLTLTRKLGPYDGMETFGTVHLVVDGTHAPVRTQYTVCTLHVFAVPVLPAVVDDA
jgi:hypothetical protein